MAIRWKWYYRRLTWDNWYQTALAGAMYCAFPAGLAYLALDWFNFFDAEFLGGPNPITGNITRGLFWCIAGAFGGVWAHQKFTFEDSQGDDYDLIPDEELDEKET